MKKLLLIALPLIMLGGCAGGNKAEKEKEDSIRQADSLAAVEATVNAAQEAAEQACLDSLKQDSISKAEAQQASDNAATAKYDADLDKLQSLVDKCFSMSKKGMSINDQALADVWMETGSLVAKLSKVKSKMSEEQKARFKKLESSFTKFCETQPA